MVTARLHNFFTKGHARSVQAKRNIAIIFLLKGVSILISFMLVPMTLHYLNPTRYGIWLTLSSVIGWITYFDIGLGNGLRNKFAEAMAQNDTPLAKAYVSTTYFIIALVITVAFGLFLLLSRFLNWSAILNAPGSMAGELHLLAVIVFAFFGLRFVFGLIGTILTADQKPALANVIDVLGSLLALILTWLLITYTQSSLLLLGSAFGLSAAVMPIAASLILFKTRYKAVVPAWKSFERRHAKELLSLGVKFFLLQIGVLIVFSTSNIVITQIFSPSDVVPYNIAFKYFSIVTMVFNIVLTPFWSAYADAYYRDDTPWIRHATQRLIAVWAVSAAAAALMVLFAQTVYALWVGKTVAVPLSLSIAMACYVTISNWNNIFASFINGTGKIRLQLYSGIAIGIVNIPLSILLGKYLGLGVAGVAYASCACMLVGAVWAPVQSFKLMNKTAAGIWGK